MFEFYLEIIELNCYQHFADILYSEVKLLIASKDLFISKIILIEVFLLSRVYDFH